MYNCNICDKEFRTKCGCTKHTLAHTVRFRCETCGKQYRRREDLKKHQQKSLHNREQPVSAAAGNFFPQNDCKKANTHKEPNIEQTGSLTQSAINGTAKVTVLHPAREDKYDLVKFLSNARPVVEKYLSERERQRSIKWYLVAQVELTREDGDGNVRVAEPFYRSVTYTLLSEATFEMHGLNTALQKLVIGLENISTNLRDGHEQ